MEYRDPKVLTPHPISVKLYGNNHLDEKFIEDIKQFGIRESLIITDKNVIVSGHRRWRVALLLGLKSVPVEVIVPYANTIDEKRAIVANNLQRDKDFSQKMRETEVWKEIEAYDAKERMLSGKPLDPTPPVAKGTETAEVVGRRVGIGGRTTFRKADKVWQEAKQGNPVAKELVKQLDKGKWDDEGISIKKAYRVLTSKELEDKRGTQRKIVVTSDITPAISFGDFRTLIKDIQDNTIDLILTDPPYPKEYLPLWGDLAREAARVLKPGHFLIAYSGQAHLMEVLDYLRQHLTYYWLGMLYHKGVTGQRFEVNMWNRAKPILFFQKPPITKQEEWIEDVIVSEEADKQFHEWGQSVSPLVKLLETFSKKGDTILDPFLGGGATIEACIETQRKGIGYEIDKNTYEQLKRRLA